MMMLRLRKTLVPMFMAVLFVAAGPLASAASATATEASHSSVAAQGQRPLQYTESFDCTIPDFDETQCGPNLTIGPGRALQVNLNQSGGKGVTFQARRVDNDAVLGTIGQQPEHTPEQIWHNDTGRAVDVSVFASSGAIVRVRAEGVYIVG